MIIVRAPLRISFVGGGSDLPDFYKVSPGKVISATIDKYVYVAINPAPLLKGITARYSTIEHVNKPEELENDRMREVLLHFGVSDNMELGVFSHMHTGTGLGGSSSFTVSLVKGLSTYLKKRLDKTEVAEIASNIEIKALKEPIGKQDQYAAAHGGINTFKFQGDESVEVDPVLLGYETKDALEKNIIVFFTGITRKANTVLNEQKNNTQSNIKHLKSMVKLVDTFQKKLLKGNFKDLGEILHENWLIKKKLASKISSSVIDELYKTGIKNGASGGKLLGAGGGGCLLFFVPPSKREKLEKAMLKKAEALKLEDFKEVPIKFTYSGVEIVSNTWLN